MRSLEGPAGMPDLAKTMKTAMIQIRRERPVIAMTNCGSFFFSNKCIDSHENNEKVYQGQQFWITIKPFTYFLIWGEYDSTDGIL